jgi:hypothetical protein
MRVLYVLFLRLASDLPSSYEISRLQSLIRNACPENQMSCIITSLLTSADQPSYIEHRFIVEGAGLPAAFAILLRRWTALHEDNWFYYVCQGEGADEFVGAFYDAETADMPKNITVTSAWILSKYDGYRVADVHIN